MKVCSSLSAAGKFLIAVGVVVVAAAIGLTAFFTVQILTEDSDPDPVTTESPTSKNNYYFQITTQQTQIICVTFAVQMLYKYLCLPGI